MKTLFIVGDTAIFTPESVSRKHLQEYAVKLGTLHVLCRSHENKDVEIVDGPLVLHGIATGKIGATKVLAQKMHDLILAEQIDVVSAQNPFELGRVAVRAVQGTSAKLHIQVHTDFLSPWFVKGAIFRSPKVVVPVLNQIRRRIADQVLPRADGIRVVSERVRDSLVNTYGNRIKTPVVIPPLPPGEPEQKVELPRHAFTFTFMTISHLEPEKRIEDSIAALATFKDRYPSAGLMVVGEGRERAVLQDLVVRSGLMGRVLFLGHRDDAKGLLGSAQAFIRANAYDGYGQTLIEAALARVPIITTDVGIVGEVFKGYEDVLAAPPGDPAALAFNMIALIEDNSEREVLVRNAETKARAHLAKYPDVTTLVVEDLKRLVSAPAA